MVHASFSLQGACPGCSTNIKFTIGNSLETVDNLGPSTVTNPTVTSPPKLQSSKPPSLLGFKMSSNGSFSPSQLINSVVKTDIMSPPMDLQTQRSEEQEPTDDLYELANPDTAKSAKSFVYTTPVNQKRKTQDDLDKKPAAKKI